MTLKYSFSLYIRPYLFFTLQFLCLEQVDAKDFNPDNPLNQPALVYWCSSKTPDQQISSKKSPGCEPLYDQQAAESFRENARQQGFDLPDRDPIKIAELQDVVSRFSNRYRTFLSCCLTTSDAPSEIIEMIDEANHILQAVRQKGVYNSTELGKRQGTNIIGMVARARENLLRLQDRLDKLNKAQQGLKEVDYETSGRVKVQIQEDEETIKKEFKAKKPPSSAPTGMEIQDTALRSRIGGEIEDTKLNSHFGADIGASVSPYSNVVESLRPRRREDGHDSQLPHRPGADMQDTSLSSSTGFEVDGAQNRDGISTLPHRGVGASIGDSDLNNKRR
ncbi:MAG: hypothetical protein HP496_01125 [Nitrospira sp.]|nr:hypothetical protein [Nitrospira sp.]